MNKCGVVLIQCKVNAFANVFIIKINSQINKKRAALRSTTHKRHICRFIRRTSGANRCKSNYNGSELGKVVIIEVETTPLPDAKVTLLFQL